MPSIQTVYNSVLLFSSRNFFFPEMLLGDAEFRLLLEIWFPEPALENELSWTPAPHTSSLQFAPICDKTKLKPPGSTPSTKESSMGNY